MQAEDTPIRLHGRKAYRQAAGASHQVGTVCARDLEDVHSLLLVRPNRRHPMALHPGAALQQLAGLPWPRLEEAISCQLEQASGG